MYLYWSSTILLMKLNLLFVKAAYLASFTIVYIPYMSCNYITKNINNILNVISKLMHLNCFNKVIGYV